MTPERIKHDINQRFSLYFTLNSMAGSIII